MKKLQKKTEGETGEVGFSEEYVAIIGRSEFRFFSGFDWKVGFVVLGCCHGCGGGSEVNDILHRLSLSIYLCNFLSPEKKNSFFSTALHHFVYRNTFPEDIDHLETNEEIHTDVFGVLVFHVGSCGEISSCND